MMVQSQIAVFSAVSGSRAASCVGLLGCCDESFWADDQLIHEGR